MAEGKGTVLIVEDDADLAGMIASALGAAGFEAIECRGGREALDRVAEDIDLVLLDRFLPDVGGDEVLAHIEADPVLREIPVVVMSVDGNREWIARLLDGGAVDYIVKPVRLDVLRARVTAAIRAKRRREALRRAEKMIERSKRELETIYDSLQEGLMLIDSDYTVTRVNRAMLRLFGKPDFSGERHQRSHPVLGGKCYRQLYGRDSVCDECPVAEAVSSGRPVEVERTPTMPEGIRFHLTVAIPAGRNAIVSIEDVTERRQMEGRRAHEKQVEAISNLAGASSHEINQPLGVISGRAQLMQMRLAESDETDGDLARDIEEILAATKRIEEIIERLHNVTDYVTKPYVGGREILDVERSTKRFDRREPRG